ncbi:MAG: iron-containing alcohol dehydrogenase [Bryobacteraceae bacterium]|jgi:alcohol dehydrogenase class IV
MTFEFATASRIVFGAGSVREVASAARQWGSRALVVTGGNPNRAGGLIRQLELAGLSLAAFPVRGEPTVAAIREGVRAAQEGRRDVVIAIGGGSAIDAGKAIAALMTNGPEPLDYLEIIGRGQPIANPSAPFIAIPTTAGTGSEVTRNAVLASPEQGVKASLRSPHMLPRLAVVDPELTFNLPAALTASTGLDALTQLLEAWVSVRANPITDGFCREGLPLVARSLRRAFHNGGDIEARSDMSLAALLSGLALANAALGAVHGFAAPVGGMFDAPHGAVCAALLPHATAVNIAALNSREPESENLRRYAEAARILIGNACASADDLISWLTDLCRDLETPSLGKYGIGGQHAASLVEKAARSNSMKGNPIALTAAELHEIIARAL